MQYRKGKRDKPTREEALELFNELKPAYGVLQREIATATGLNQGAVSKILRGSFRKLEGRAYLVWKYASEQAAKAGYEPRRTAAERVDTRLSQRINEVWDRTAEGADALLKLLDAADLMLKKRKTER